MRLTSWHSHFAKYYQAQNSHFHLSPPLQIEGIIECYESAADLGLALMGSTTRSSFNLTLSGVLEMALLRSILLQMKHGQVCANQSERIIWVT